MSDTEVFGTVAVPVTLEVRRLVRDDVEALSRLFADLAADPGSAHFHPHALTPAEATWVAEYPGRDLYLGVFEHGVLIGYGLLRGWDAGFTVPSLGICLAPSARGRGLARRVMHALHAMARDASATRIRLKVHPDNLAAVALYTALGYVFDNAPEAGQRVGWMDLADSAAPGAPASNTPQESPR